MACLLAVSGKTMNDTTVVYLEIRYSDGSRQVAEGSDAAAIMEWFNSCEVMNYIHGVKYSGPGFRRILPEP